MHARPEVQHLIEPLVVGWGWGEDRLLTYGSNFLDYLQFLGTNDLSAYFAVPDAIQFQKAHQWEQVQANCHTLLQNSLTRLEAITGLGNVYPHSSAYSQMAIAPLPAIADLPALKAQLYTDYQIEVPLTTWQKRPFLRISIQAYNTPSDVDTLLEALGTLLP